MAILRATQDAKMQVVRAILKDDDTDPFVALYAIDLVLFGGENMAWSSSVDRQAKDLLLALILGDEHD